MARTSPIAIYDVKGNMSKENELLNDSEFKIRVLTELTKLDSKVERLSSHLESEVGNQERAMGRLEKALEVSADNMKDENQKLHDSITAIHKDVFVGNGKPSVATRLDRLEQHSESRGRYIALLWVTVLGIAATIFGEYIINKIEPKNPAPTAISAPATPAKTP